MTGQWLKVNSYYLLLLAANCFLLSRVKFIYLLSLGCIYCIWPRELVVIRDNFSVLSVGFPVKVLQAALQYSLHNNFYRTPATTHHSSQDFLFHCSMHSISSSLSSVMKEALSKGFPVLVLFSWPVLAREAADQTDLGLFSCLGGQRRHRGSNRPLIFP